MRKILFSAFFLLLIIGVNAQTQPITKNNAAPNIQQTGKMSVSDNMQDIKWGTESHVIVCSDFGVTPPLRELIEKTPTFLIESNEIKEAPDKRNMPVQTFQYNVMDHGAKYGNEPSIVQSEFGQRIGHEQNRALEQNWAGQTVTGFRPMDPSGAAGPNHYIQMINSTTYRIYNKTGTSLGSGTFGNLWSTPTGDAGDPIVLYDKAADRWFMSQFDDGSGADANDIHIAISQTSDPTGSWYTYTFTSPDFPDYLKFSAWQDGYYMTANYAEKIFAFNRTKMLAGDASAEAVYQTYSPAIGGTGQNFFVPLPADASDGVMPGAGTPCPIFCYKDNGWASSTIDAVVIYNATVNWSTVNMTVTTAATLPTAAFDASYDTGWDDISQPGTSQKLDGIGGAMMFRAQWKTWSGYNTVVLNWAVQVTSTQRGIFWCELRQNQTTEAWTIYQQGIYAPGTDSYWLGSIAMNDNGDIGLSYAKASSSTYMSLAYTGRYAADPLGSMTMTEVVAKAGSGAQTGTNRVGDYAQTCLDPDGETFWYTGEYIGAGGAAKTQIYSYKFIANNLPTVLTTDVSAITLNSATSGGEVTLDGGSAVTARGIVWGLNANPTLSDNVITDAGTGTGSFTSNITGLSEATTYNVRAYATNANGTSYGANIQFTTLMSCVDLSTDFTMGFEDTESLSGWLLEDSNGDAFVWNIYAEATFARTGTNFAAVDYDPSAANDWLITPCFNLSAGVTYDLSFWYRTYSASFPEEMDVYIGTVQSSAMSQLITDIGSVTNDTYAESLSSFTVPSNGEYYIGFHNKSTASRGYLCIDDINLSSSVPAPVAAFSGTPLTICEGSSVTFTDASSNTPTSWSWDFGDATAAVTTANATHTYANAGTYTVTLTATNAGGTDDEIKTNYVTVVAAPDAGSNGTLTVCEGTTPTNAQLFAALGGSPDAGGAWTHSGLVYTYTVTAVSPCTVNATATVTVTEQAAPDAGSNGTLTVCEGTTPTNAQLFAALGGSPDAGGVWTHSGLVYTYTVTATNPCSVNATATVTVTEQAAPDAGSNGTLTVCEGTTPTNAQLFAALGGSPDAGGAWTHSGLVYTYTVTAVSPCSVNATATVTVTEQAAPDAGSNGTLTVCEGTTPTNAQLFAALGGSPDAGGTWTHSGLVYTYTVTAVSPCAGTSTATVTLTEQAVPDAGTNGTLTVCEGTTPTNAELFAALGGSPDAGGAWTHSGLVYTYTVTATNPCSVNATATVTVTEQAAPNAGSNGALTVCEGTTPTNAELFAALGGTPDAGGTWTHSGLVYTYTVTAVSPCSVNATATVTVTEQTVPNAGTNGTLTVCEGTTPTNAQLFAALGGSPDAGGSWTHSGLVYTYSVTLPDPCVGTATATVTVTEQAAPDAGTNGTLAVCEGTIPTNAQLFAALGGSPDAGGAWTNSGLVYTYTVTATSPCTLNATANVSVTEDPLPVEASSATADESAICNGESTTISYAGGSGDTFVWYTGSCGASFVGSGNDLLVSPTTTTTYYGRWENTCGNSNCVTVEVIVDEMPSLSMSATNAGCGVSDGTATVVASGGTGVYSYIWDDASTQTSDVATGLGQGVYNVQVTSGACTATDMATVNENGAPVVGVSATLTEICVGATTVLTATGADTYEWTPATGLDATTGDVVNATPASSITYTVTGTTSGCSASESVAITVNHLPVASFTIDASGEPIIDFTNTSTNADSYSWDLGDGTVVTTADVSHEYTVNDTYTVVLSATNGCGTVTDDQTVMITNIGIASLGKESIKIFPNPTESVINVVLPVENVNIKIVDMDGRMLRSIDTKDDKKVEINIEDFADGIYNLIITTESNEQVIVKVVKK